MSHVTQKFKLPGENLSIPIDFVDSLITTSPAESITAVEAIARDKKNDGDISSTIVAAVTFSGTVVTVRLQGGTKGQKIAVDVLATTDLAASPDEKVGHRIDLEVE